jgi:hypothetical protein
VAVKILLYIIPGNKKFYLTGEKDWLIDEWKMGRMKDRSVGRFEEFEL